MTGRPRELRSRRAGVRGPQGGQPTWPISVGSARGYLGAADRSRGDQRPAFRRRPALSSRACCPAGPPRRPVSRWATGSRPSTAAPSRTSRLLPGGRWTRRSVRNSRITIERGGVTEGDPRSRAGSSPCPACPGGFQAGPAGTPRRRFLATGAGGNRSGRPCTRGSRPRSARSRPTSGPRPAAPARQREARARTEAQG